MENKNKNVNNEIKPSIFKKSWVKSLSVIIIIILLLVALTIWKSTVNKIKIENSSISAPIINLSPTTMGTLEEIYVKVGDNVLENTPVAKVGSEIIASKISGIITSVNHLEGQVFTPGTPVVSMINPQQERVVGKVDENKGLSDIKIGQVATFTVDAFGNKKFEGIVDEISPVSDQSSVVFNISDKREVKQFDVKIRFNIDEHPEFKQGMSAKITIFKN